MIEQELVVIVGDGVGREVIPLAVQLLRHLRPDVRLHYEEAGRTHARRTGQALDPETVGRIRTVGSALIGPLATEPAQHNAYPQLRDELDLFATLYPFPHPSREGDLLLLSPSFADTPDGSIPFDLWNAGRVGPLVERLLRGSGSTTVTVAHDDWPAFGEAVRAGLPGTLEVRPVAVSELLNQWEPRVRETGLIVASNIASRALLPLLALQHPLSGIGKLVVGSRGMVATPAHGPLDEEVGWGFSNPLGAIRALEALLRYGWGYEVAAAQLSAATDRALAQRRPPAQGGLHTMYEVQRAILRTLA